MSESLQTLNDQWIEMQSLLNQSGGVLDENQEARFDEICAALAEKRGAYVFVRENIESQIEQGKQWIATFQAKVKQLEKRNAYLEQKVIDSMELQGVDVQETELGKVRIMESTSCEIVSEKELPPEYVSIVQTIKIDKRKALADLKTGAEIPGAALLKKKRLQVYK